MEALYLTLHMEESSGRQVATPHRAAGAARESPLVNERYHGPLIHVIGAARESYHKVLCSVFTQTRSFSDQLFASSVLPESHKAQAPDPGRGGTEATSTGVVYGARPERRGTS
jgi:hypothetical protein